ncbi:MAG: hypothetical protein O8C66_13485 [Candidatus Methanoperedens sp.]|nr:hypothetical protein [Candidatus Methanoperedens sp.]MCZ7371510.1 hypothetical protein [Candidatus Methanoperedens sp.]
MTTLTENISVRGMTKEAMIGITLILSWFILYFGSEYKHFFEKYPFELILLYIVLLTFIQTRSTVEINNNHIKISTLLSRVLGSTTRSIDSVHSIQVKEKKTHKLAIWLIVLMGLLWFFTFLVDIIRGVPIEKLNQNLLWIVFSFGLGYFTYIEYKARFYIQIKFFPYPSINKILIHTKNAQGISDVLEANENRNDIGAGGLK